MPNNNRPQPRPLSESLPNEFVASPEAPEIWTDIPGLYLPHIKEMHELTGATEADNVRHLLVRVEFLNCLCEDSRVLAWLQSQAEETGFSAAALELAAALDNVAEHIGVEHRGMLWREIAADNIPIQNDAVVEELLREVHLAVERLITAHDYYGDLVQAAGTFVRDELRLPWVWLAWEFAELLRTEAWCYICDVEPVRGYQLDPEDPPAPEFTFTFEKCAGETANQLYNRFLHEVNNAALSLRSAINSTRRVPVGRMPPSPDGKAGKDQGRYERWARWLYRNRLGGDSIRLIAKSYHAESAHSRPFAECDCRPTVRNGIKEAERLLGLTPYHF